MLASLLFAMAALVQPGQQIAVAVEMPPAGGRSQVARLDPAMVRQALVRELQAAGVVVGMSPDLPRLIVRVGSVDPGDVLALGQKASLATTAELVQPGAPDRPTARTPLPPAACNGSAKFGLLSTPGQRARLALARCIDDLAGQIVASVAGNGESVLVR